MTSSSEIDAQIKNDYDKFWFSVYDAELPASIIYRFRMAIMFSTVKTLQASPQVLLDLLSAKEEDLKFVHVGIIINTVFSSPFNAIFDSPEEALNSVIEFKEIEVQFNKAVEKRSQELERKRQKLMEIAGHGAKTINLNGIKKN
jgi:hypothetical protein